MRQLLIATAAVLTGIAPASARHSLDFDTTFRSGPQPRQSHYTATYRLADGEHRLEVWRQGDTRLRRRTDSRVETIVSKAPGDAEWSMVVLDRMRRLRTDVARTNLMRIGHFTDWLALARSLARPIGPYILEALPHGGAATVQPIGRCRWYRLSQAARRSDICWSSAQQLPLAIVDGDGVVQWRVLQSDNKALASATFVVDDAGFFRHDANADIQAD